MRMTVKCLVGFLVCSVRVMSAPLAAGLVLDGLLDQLRSKDLAVRRAAALALAQTDVSPQEDLKKLIHRLSGALDDVDSTVRFYCGAALNAAMYVAGDSFRGSTGALTETSIK